MQLTFDRQQFLRHVKLLLTKFNIALTRACSRVPEFTKPEGYREVVVSARGTQPASKQVKSLHSAGQQHEQALSELSVLIKQADPNNEIFQTDTQITAQSDELIRYLRQIQYDSAPTMYSLPGMQDDKRTPLLRAVFEFKQSVRSMKSAILSS